ncbi:MAG: BamA/TamA family outer membrane protein, partial [Gammaproteobacteria bacterium]|nr:BamA/TamA family outer membrane protein [Gammaproteobacteria bacterium]
TTQDNFNSSGLFTNVSLSTAPDKAQNLQVPLQVNVTPHKSKQYNFGLGYGTDTGARGNVGFDLYNLTTNGQRMNGNLRIASNEEAALESHYIIPGSNPVTDRYDLSAGVQAESYDFGRNAVVKVGPGYTTVVHGWQQTVRVNLQSEWWKFTRDADKFTWRDIDNDGYNYATLLVPSISWLRRATNNPVSPTKGYRINVSVLGAAQHVISNVTFGQMLVDAKILQPLWSGSIFVARGSFGYTAINKDDETKLPMSFWFTAGGAQSVRGYQYQGIGPGTKLAVGSAELRQKVYRKFYLAAFYDSGIASDNWKQPYSQSTGVGLVWLSPVGAMELTYAKPLHSDRTGMVQFNMGVEL